MTQAPQQTPLSDRSRQLTETGYRYFTQNYKPREMVLDRGEGSMLWDIDGNEYIDLGAGIAVNSLGHAHPELRKALEAQAAKLWHTSNVFFTEPAIRLTETLARVSGFGRRVYLCNSGAEANEAAIKTTRKWASEQGRAPDHREIITFKGSFHGRTMATVTATAQPKYHEGFEPMPGGFVYCEKFNDEAALEALVTEKTCAIMVEPLQGEGGIVPAKPGFLKFLRQLADKHNLLLIFDEIQCGMMRTGKMFAFEHEGVVPDLLSLAKALGGGFPIGACVMGAKVADTLKVGSHGTTFGGNPMAASVALKAIEIYQRPETLRNIEARATQLRDGLSALHSKYDGLFREVRGQGLMLGAELSAQHTGKSSDIMEAGRQHGVLILVAGPNVVRFLPPLNITEAELAQGLERLDAAFAAYLGK